MRAFAHLRPFRPTRLTSWRLALYPALLLGGCSIAPDPYLGTIDPTGWDARFGGVSVLTNTPPCVAPLTALRKVGEHESKLERRYYISSRELTAEQLAAAVRGHWGIESVPQAHRKEVRNGLTNCVEATRKMRVGPSGSAFRSGPQTTPSCCGQESWW